VDAGLPSGEIKGLDWGDLDLRAGLVSVRRSLHRGVLTSPKSGRERTLPMTERLETALKDLRHLKGEAVFCKADGERYTRCELDWRLKKVCRKAQLRWIGWHALRHTFCSHLAMRGAPPRTIQELAGHSSLGITQRYMHLTPGAAKKPSGGWRPRRRGEKLRGVQRAKGGEPRTTPFRAAPLRDLLRDRGLLRTS
jgi:integrase